MKLIKSLVVAGAVALALGSIQARAQQLSLFFPVDSEYLFEPLNFNLTVTTQALLYTNHYVGNTLVAVSTTKTQKITTQTILKALAAAYNTTWPSGAKLAVDVLGGDVFVVDKTGMNPICDLTADDATNYVYVSFQPSANYNVVVGKQLQFPYGYGLEKLTTTAPVSCELDCYLDGVESVHLYLSGNDNVVFTMNPSVATQTDDATFLGNGEIGGSNASVSGQITGHGSWKSASSQGSGGGDDSGGDTGGGYGDNTLASIFDSITSDRGLQSCALFILVGSFQNGPTPGNALGGPRIYLKSRPVFVLINVPVGI